jgi:hypothetical protein
MRKKMGKKMRKEHYLVNIIKNVIIKRKYLSSYESIRNISNKRYNTRTTIRKEIIISVVTMFVIVFIYQTGLMGSANALTRYYNCTTRVANKNGTLSLQNIENCYDQVFKGAEQAEKDEASLKTSDSLS